jgi:hypothetical protein
MISLYRLYLAHSTKKYGKHLAYVVGHMIRILAVRLGRTGHDIYVSAEIDALGSFPLGPDILILPCTPVFVLCLVQAPLVFHRHGESKLD